MTGKQCSRVSHWRVARPYSGATIYRIHRHRSLSAQRKPYPLSGLNQPVYSLVTLGTDKGPPTMNIVTYCAPMSIQPRTVALGLFKGTQSWKNFLANEFGVLQVLCKEHMGLFPLLGQASAVNDSAKMSSIAEAHPTLSIYGHEALSGCHGYVYLRMMQAPVNAGDHDVVICSVVEYEQLGDAAADILSTDFLRHHGLM